MRLIDADALIEEICNERCACHRRECTLTWEEDGCSCCTSVYDIEFAPTADAKPVRHGRWILKRIGAGHTWECSCCHKQPCIYITNSTNYCPNCGAKMDEEDIIDG